MGFRRAAAPRCLLGAAAFESVSPALRTKNGTNGDFLFVECSLDDDVDAISASSSAVDAVASVSGAGASSGTFHAGDRTSGSEPAAGSSVDSPSSSSRPDPPVDEQNLTQRE